GRQPRGRALPQPPVGPAVHPQPGGERGRRAALAARAPLIAHFRVDRSRGECYRNTAPPSADPDRPVRRAGGRRRPGARRAAGGPDPETRGPLGALRRLGGGELTVLAGLALGAGERGLGYVCRGPAATAAAAVAVAVEPGLRPRLLADGPPADPLHR